MQFNMQSMLKLLSNGKDDATDADMQEILASEGGSSSHQDYLLLHEQFKLNALILVRSNASIKGGRAKLNNQWVC